MTMPQASTPASPQPALPSDAAAPPMTARGAVTNVGRGALMGLADVVPGVSGGTVALILGIYTRLVDAIRRVDSSFFRSFGRVFTGGKVGRSAFAQRWKDMDAWFLVFLVMGIGLGVLTASRPMHWLMEHQPVATLAFFFGLVLASTLVPWRMIGRRGALTAALVLAGAVAAYVLTGLPELNGPEGIWFIPIAGAIAIMAMILPGISGAYLLVVIGMYEPMLAALNRFDLPRIFLFIGGAFFGLLAFSRLLSYLLHRRRDPTLAVLLGLMIGSLRRVWPFKEGGTGEFASGYNVLPDVQAPQTLIAAAAFLFGLTLILVLDYTVQRHARRQKPALDAKPA